MIRNETAPRRILVKLSTVLLSVVFSLLVFEVVLRIVNYYPSLTDRTMYVSHNNELLPHKLKPNYEGYYLGKKVRIDSDGYRVVKPSSNFLSSEGRKSPDKIILLIGDSLVFGHGLSDEETIGSQVQNSLFAKQLNYRVKNIGVAGYTSWNEYAALLDYLNRYSADLVIVLYVPNDVTLNNDQLGIGEGRYSVLGNTYFHRFTQFLYRHFYTSYLLRDSLLWAVTLLSNNRAVRDYSAYLDDSAMDYSMMALDKIHEVCMQRGMGFSVGIYRDIWYYNDAKLSLTFEQKIKEYLDKRGIKSFSMNSHISELKINEARRHWNDPHPSPKAVGFIAGDIIGEIDRSLSR